jgi:ParB-like chromosome segregation protein Spo0J
MKSTLGWILLYVFIGSIALLAEYCFDNNDKANSHLAVPQVQMTEYEVKLIALSDIDADYAWNSRSPANTFLSTVSETDSESSGLEGLTRNILSRGQDTPVDVRPTAAPFYKMCIKPWSLVAGFRRFTAITAIAANDPPLEIPNLLAGHIRATLLPHMTEKEAFLRNASENTNRDQLSPPDIFRLVKKGTEELEMSPAELAIALGKLPTSIANYARLGKLDSSILNHWLHGGEFQGIQNGKRVAVADLFELSRQTNDHVEGYKKLLLLQSQIANSSAWLEKARGRATAMGTMLAKLQKRGFLSVHTPAWIGDVDVMVRVGKRDLKMNDARDLAQRAESAYKKELIKPPPAVGLNGELESLDSLSSFITKES